MGTFQIRAPGLEKSLDGKAGTATDIEDACAHLRGAGCAWLAGSAPSFRQLGRASVGQEADARRGRRAEGPENPLHAGRCTRGRWPSTCPHAMDLKHRCSMVKRTITPRVPLSVNHKP